MASRRRSWKGCSLDDNLYTHGTDETKLHPIHARTSVPDAHQRAHPPSASHPPPSSSAISHRGDDTGGGGGERSALEPSCSLRATGELTGETAEAAAAAAVVHVTVGADAGRWGGALVAGGLFSEAEAGRRLDWRPSAVAGAGGGARVPLVESRCGLAGEDRRTWPPSSVRCRE